MPQLSPCSLGCPSPSVLQGKSQSPHLRLHQFPPCHPATSCSSDSWNKGALLFQAPCLLQAPESYLPGQRFLERTITIVAYL